MGYDLYVKLLNEAVLEEKGQTVREKTECLVSLAFDACLPKRYVHTAGERIALYKRISLIGSAADLDDMKDELCDRYGALPRPAENLLHIALIRAMAEQCNINSIRQQGNEISLYSPDFDTAVWTALAKEFPGQLRMMLSGSPYIRFKPKGNALTATETLLTRLLAETTKKG